MTKRSTHERNAENENNGETDNEASEHVAEFLTSSFFILQCTEKYKYFSYDAVMHMLHFMSSQGLKEFNSRHKIIYFIYLFIYDLFSMVKVIKISVKDNRNETNAIMVITWKYSSKYRKQEKQQRWQLSRGRRRQDNAQTYQRLSLKKKITK